MSKRGLYGKYIISKADGSEVDPKAKYFVLRADTDKHARKALLAYAESVREDNPTLAKDIVLEYKLYENPELLEG